MNAVRKRAAFGQNFLRRSSTARLILGHVALEPGDRVYDLGAGTGILTNEIAGSGAHTIAVERDGNLARKLHQRFAGTNVSVVESDLNDVAFVAPFKVVANIPFNRTAALLKRLLFEAPHPDEALLLLQREAAEKYAGVGRLTLVSLLAMPWFELRIVHRFVPHDFFPAPGVDTVLLHIAQRTTPLLSALERTAWKTFVHHALGRTKPDARRTFRDVLSNLQWRLLSRDLAIPDDAPLNALTQAQWLGIYRFIRRHAPTHKQRRMATFAGIGRYP